jgi:hypothetical protein
METCGRNRNQWHLRFAEPLHLNPSAKEVARIGVLMWDLAASGAQEGLYAQRH